ncbi:MAG: putative serine protease, partial [Friedmanniella sp.]|nr:putative serine protease [Friedmanniella sp.]
MPRSAAVAVPPGAGLRGRAAGRTGLPALAVGVALLLLPATAQADPTPRVAPPATPVRSAAPGDRADAPYVVTLAEAPVATYVGGVPGLAGTSPARGTGLDLAAPRTLDYRSYLRRRQAQVAAVAGIRPTQRYTVALNGFAARLTPDQVRRLRATPGVVRVSPDALVHVTDQSRNVDYLKLSGASGLWHTLGGRSRSGRGVVVGVVDTGIWPESASFAGHPLAATAPPASDRYRAYRVGSQIRMRKADGHLFTGTCESGQRFTAQSCSTKLVGARTFGTGWLAGVAAGDVDDFRSPRDGDGHGTHTASTAVGDADVPATVGGKSAGRVSGVAPGA